MTPQKYIGSVPDDFLPDSDWNSHRPLLWLALQHLNGLVVELGCGDGSTPLFCKEYCLSGRPFYSFETNKEWADKFKGITQLVDSYFDQPSLPPIDILFIDSAPGEERARLIEEYRYKAKVIIVHDTEPGAEYVYHMKEVLSKFRYRRDLQGKPQTTAVSDTYDFAEWQGLLNGEYLIDRKSVV